MILAFDTYYYNNCAKTVCIEFEDWSDSDFIQSYTGISENIEEYVPGGFYKRELPCILSLLGKIDMAKVDFIIIDGYVFLDDDGKFGLGAHLYEALNGKIPVVGIAKSNFQTLNKLKRTLLRGESRSPLFITGIGADIDIIAGNVKQMHGGFRMPTLLKTLDRMTKSLT